LTYGLRTAALMRTRIEVASEAGIVTVGDSQTALPAGLDPNAFSGISSRWRDRVGSSFSWPMTRSSIESSCVRRRLRQRASPASSSRWRRLSARRAERKVAVSGWDEAGHASEAGALAVSPGPHLLSALARRPFDGARHAEDMSELLGAEWKFMQTVDRLGLVGCLPLAVTAICVMASRWHWLWYVLPVLAVSYLPYIVMKRSRRTGRPSSGPRSSNRRSLTTSSVLTETQDRGVAGGFLRT
jgi:hypothetical protein